MTLTKEQSSNKERYEAAKTSEIISIIRCGMEAGCIRPCHLYDAVDEIICCPYRNLRIAIKGLGGQCE